MMETIDTTQCPVWFEMEDPEERKYWATGIKWAGVATGVKSYLCFDSERAAWIHREKWMNSDGFIEVLSDSPIPRTRIAVSNRALELDRRLVQVLSETGQIVESWTI